MSVLSLDISLQLAGFSLAVKQDIALSGVTSVFGPSGSGKSTLLRIIAGLEQRAVGTVRFAGEAWQDGVTRLAPERRGVGYVFQDARLFAHLDVRGNLDYALKRARGGPGLEEVAAALDLAPLFRRSAATLSGGEKQRAAIGRALLSAPRILLLDEPLASLDEARKAEILPYLERLRDIAGVPIIHVSHSLNETARLANEIIILKEGRVVLAGAAAHILSDPDAAPLLGIRDAGAMLRARVARHEEDGLTLLHASGGPLLLPGISAHEGAEIMVRILARDVILSRARPEGLSALNILPCVVTALREGEGPGVMVQLRWGEDLLLARLTRRSAGALGLKPGIACHAVLKSVAVAQGEIGGQGAVSPVSRR